jgi:hypothetical protein
MRYEILMEKPVGIKDKLGNMRAAGRIILKRLLQK